MDKEELFERITNCHDTIEVSDICQIIVACTEIYKIDEALMALFMSIIATVYANANVSKEEKEQRAKHIAEVFGNLVSVQEPISKNKEDLN